MKASICAFLFPNAQVGGHYPLWTRMNGSTGGCALSNVLLNMTQATHEELTGKDASWILTTAVIIFTMQTGKELKEVSSTCRVYLVISVNFRI